ncbi:MULTISPECIES: hypothetical protein [unclassified Kitasatospora]|uniref:DUF7848 domain-containing protein n=1 Tax=unclassified Kitasatospora TaxID=2633591 RepID=UPI002473BFF6|nr:MULTISPECIES: hypothetical protein [unclassified Kitasatospora]MDH6123822.1 hypothetical protein [Kitasatospora sp. GP82]MDH6576079.1 hypothetical protein [Kitasatospora sp. MAP5-34]
MTVRQQFRFRAYHVKHNPETAPVGIARCTDGEGLCMWSTDGAPASMDDLTKAVSAHTAESGHTAFLRTVTDAVTVVPGKWDGE